MEEKKVNDDALYKAEKAMAAVNMAEAESSAAEAAVSVAEAESSAAEAAVSGTEAESSVAEAAVSMAEAESSVAEAAVSGTEAEKPADGAVADKPKAKKVRPEVISINGLGVRFNMTEQKVDSLKEYFIRLVKHELRYKEFWALKDISLSVLKGQRVGILGLNGAGKSTLLKCIAGVLKPTEGSISVTGNVVPLLELGAGFDKEYTGAENIYLYGSMLGYSRKFLDEKFDEIVNFSELGKFIDVPVKNYSSGMKARLGFSIATVVNPEILILDEVLSVGDAKFKKKSAKKLKSMMKKGVTVLLVSHSTSQVLSICNRAIILKKGKLIASGKAEKVCAKYERMIKK